MNSALEFIPAYDSTKDLRVLDEKLVRQKANKIPTIIIRLLFVNTNNKAHSVNAWFEFVRSDISRPALFSDCWVRSSYAPGTCSFSQFFLSRDVLRLPSHPSSPSSVPRESRSRREGNSSLAKGRTNCPGGCEEMRRSCERFNVSTLIPFTTTGNGDQDAKKEQRKKVTFNAVHHFQRRVYLHSRTKR